MKKKVAAGLCGLFAVVLLSDSSEAAAPVIRAQPQAAAVTTGQQVQFTVAYASSCGAVREQWQFLGVNVSNGTTYSGTTTDTLTVNATATQAGSYRVVLTCRDGSGGTISNAANLTVTATGTATTLPPMIGTLAWSNCSTRGNRCSISWSSPNGAVIAGRLTITPMGGAPVDVTGLTGTVVTPTRSTIYTLTASNAAGSYSRNVLVPVGGYTATIRSCGAITQPGRYLIASSIRSTSPSAACLDVKNTTNVYIDCSPGVTISGLGGGPVSPGSLTTSGAINFTNVHGFAVRGCRVAMSAQPNGWYFTSFINSSMGYVFDTTLGSPTLNSMQSAQAYQSNYITFASDTIYNGIELHDNSTGLSIAGCTITNTNRVVGAYTPANVFEWGGGASGTTVIDSTLDGGATAPGIGADDGIVGDSLSNELYAYNVLKNYWDAGIELTSQSNSITIHKNTLVNAGFGAIDFNRKGTLRDSIVSWNTIDMSGNFQPAGGHAYGLYFLVYAPAGATLYFQNNSFNNNVIINGMYSVATQFITAAAAGGTWVVGDNVFFDNNFNSNNVAGIEAPAFTTPYLAGIAIDQGGNVCAHPNPPNYPLVCH